MKSRGRRKRMRGKDEEQEQHEKHMVDLELERKVVQEQLVLAYLGHGSIHSFVFSCLGCLQR